MNNLSVSSLPKLICKLHELSHNLWWSQLGVLDGWWYEENNSAKGWAIYNDTPSVNLLNSDKSDASKLYSLLEEKIISLYDDKESRQQPLEVSIPPALQPKKTDIRIIWQF